MNNLADNKKAFFDYEILEKLEAGIVLSGQETKSVKNGQASLKGTFVTFHKNNAFLTNMNISPYKQAGPLPEYEPTKSRRLLLHKREIDYLREKSQEQGLTIVPLRVYTKNRFIKVEIAVARGKKQYDKRETIKNRDTEREIRRTLKNRA
ncbi:MAG: SsrA-binding protein [Candidatus Magasanikbacteria bacterium CG10_big_fil_rev_8_21_14_0_10_36_32]|uniref:SsrA-binding protein n=1 Tax=Candidatus Magasanikbacteria bacterium CG10_big_fil_rev_8_21_14_0_10_36_32 TaxID=1974646 RepID=A0A2M6W5L9_9BACT|nr:MAG: SsrA-binding protein [Candidatus Magasanikbacteria bacterium CG10_big_fil_rev_8_21_14_0_10_36_32]